MLFTSLWLVNSIMESRWHHADIDSVLTNKRYLYVNELALIVDKY